MSLLLTFLGAGALIVGGILFYRKRKAAQGDTAIQGYGPATGKPYTPGVNKKPADNRPKPKPPEKGLE